MRGFKLLLATGAVGLAIAGIAIGTAGPSNPSPRASDRSDAGAVPALTARQQQAADDYAKLPVSFVENQGQTDRARALLRTGQWLQLLHDTERSDVVVRQGLDRARRLHKSSPSRCDSSVVTRRSSRRVPSAHPA